MTNAEATNLAIAVFGAALGLTGTVISLIALTDSRRVRLRVVPKLGAEHAPGHYFVTDKIGDNLNDVTAPGTPRKWCIIVTNLSTFPVTVNEIGFGDPRKGHHGMVYLPEKPPGVQWPVRLEPRQSVPLYLAEGEPLPRHVIGYPYAYAETDCGKVAFGTSEILKAEAAKLAAKQ